MTDSKDRNDEVVFCNDNGKKFEIALGHEKNIEAISRHIADTVGNESANVFHEFLSNLVHIDIHLVEASERFPFKLLVTSGMSDRAMTVPEELDEYRFAELCIALPPDWPLDEESIKDQRNYWPIYYLKALARLPHEYDSFLIGSHTVGGDADDEPFADNTRFNGMLVISPEGLPDDFKTMTLDDGTVVHFWQLLPLYPEEMAFKRKHDFEKLFEHLCKHNVSTTVNINRPNTCKRKKFFGIF